MKRVFLDTNILMDAAEGREHGDEASLTIPRTAVDVVGDFCFCMVVFRLIL